jgi:hypothetical protein
MKRLTLLWIIVLVTLVPYGIYYLLFQAPRDEYAFIITFVLFWTFGFWGVAGPIVSALKIRSVFNALEKTRSGEEIRKLIQGNESRDVVIDLIAAENHLPRFIANRVYIMMVKRLSGTGKSPDKAS